MPSILRLLLCLSLALLASTACRKTSGIRSSTMSRTPDTLIAGTVINSAGSWTASTSEGNTKLDLTVSGTSINWTITTRQEMGNFGSSSGSSGSGMSLSSPADPWFAYVESPARLWFFNGKDELTYHFRDSDGGSDGGTSIYSGKLDTDSPPVPNDLVARLPAELRKLFPHVEPPGKRPSL